jgi:hypothetical protein
MKRTEREISRINTMHAKNYCKSGSNHHILQKHIDSLLTKMINWSSNDYQEVVNHITKKNFRLRNKYFVKAEYSAKIQRVIEEIKIASLKDYLWQPNQYDEEEIFNLTKILKLVDNNYCDIQLSKAYIHWYDKYDFERIQIFMVTILRYFASIEEFEEEIDAYSWTYREYDNIRDCIKKYKRQKTIFEILK